MSSPSPLGFAGWFTVEPGMHICVPNKCGSTSFRAALSGPDQPSEGSLFRARMREEGRGPFTPAQVAQLSGTKILFLRHPVDRFRSLWRDGPQSGRLNPPAGEEPGFWKQFDTPDSLLDYIEEFPAGNQHWLPQYGYLVPGAVLRPSIALSDTLCRLGYDAGRKNATRGTRDEPGMPIERIQNEAFRQDYLLWLQVMG